jgi:5-methylcytosine-specific restriction endonuclease McrA
LFEDALDARIREVEKQKLAATSQPRASRRGSGKNSGHIPAYVRRAVWERDGARCTFVSESGRRCEATKGLQFDHVLEVARGGEAAVEDIRLRCWAHNQYTAECTFGAEFMRHKRIAAAEARRSAKAAFSP